MAQMKLKPYWIYEFLSYCYFFSFLGWGRVEAQNLRITFSLSFPFQQEISYNKKYQQHKRNGKTLPSPLSVADFLLLLPPFDPFMERKEKVPNVKWEMGEHNKCDEKKTTVVARLCALRCQHSGPRSNHHHPYPIWWRLMKQQLMWTKNIPLRRLYRTINSHSCTCEAPLCLLAWQPIEKHWTRHNNEEAPYLGTKGRKIPLLFFFSSDFAIVSHSYRKKIPSTPQNRRMLTTTLRDFHSQLLSRPP